LSVLCPLRRWPVSHPKSIVYGVSCGKEYSLPLSVFMGENITCLQNHPIPVNERSTATPIGEI
jgi:hypothetical protein